MRIVKGKVIPLLLVFLMPLFLSGCFIFNFNYSGLLFDLNVGGNGAVPVQEISDSESELYSDGPIDLPVTIAKLDAPDVQKVSVEVTTGAGFLVEGGPLGADDGAFMVITGGSGAVNFEQTPGLLAYVVGTAGIALDTQTVVDAQEDGSFQIRIPISDPNLKVSFAGVTADLVYSSSFLTVVPQSVVENGSERKNYVIVTTNTNLLNAAQTVMSDGSGYYYLGLQEGGSNTFLRRNLDGTQAQIIEEDSETSVDIVMAQTERKIAYVTSDGLLKLSIPSSIPLSLTGNAPPLDDKVTSLTKILATLPAYDPSTTKIMVVGSEDAVILSQYGVTLGVDYIRTTSGSDTPLIRDTPYDDAKVALAVGEDAMYAFVLYEGSYLFYRVDLSGSIATAWSNKTLLGELPDVGEILSVEASDDGGVVADTVTSGGEREILYWNEADGFVAINDPSTDGSVYANPKISRDGAVIMTCKLGDAATGNQFVYFRPGVDTAGVLHDVTSETEFSVCDESIGSVYIDPNQFMHFYRSPIDGSVPQHAVLNLNQLNF